MLKIFGLLFFFCFNIGFHARSFQLIWKSFSAIETINLNLNFSTNFQICLTFNFTFSFVRKENLNIRQINFLTGKRVCGREHSKFPQIHVIPSSFHHHHHYLSRGQGRRNTILKVFYTLETIELILRFLKKN